MLYEAWFDVHSLDQFTRHRGTIGLNLAVDTAADFGLRVINGNSSLNLHMAMGGKQLGGGVSTLDSRGGLLCEASLAANNL